ncbi:hypothetical protein ACFWVT_35380 [Streptomyces cyaneofuscatus]|uniref:hypothetical protein n=1 Tax=Streptomyces cyaneofuscatus TaxID=66883 RepID=UPI003667FDAD
MPGRRLRQAPPVLGLGHRQGMLGPDPLQLGAQRADVVQAVLLLLVVAAGRGRARWRRGRRERSAGTRPRASRPPG